MPCIFIAKQIHKYHREKVNGMRRYIARNLGPLRTPLVVRRHDILVSPFRIRAFEYSS